MQITSINRYPFISYAAICLLVGTLLSSISLIGYGYNDGSVGSITFVLRILWSFLAFPFYLSSELLFSLNGGAAVSHHLLISSAMGVAFCAVCETVLHFVRSRRIKVGAV